MWLAILCCCIAFNASGFQQVSDDSSQLLPGAIAVLIDDEQVLTIDDVAGIDMQNQFRRLDEAMPNFGISADKYWLRVQLDFSQNQQQYAFYLATAMVEHLRFYQFRNGGWQGQTLGLAYPQSNKAIWDSEFFLPLGQLQGKQTFYFELHNHGTTQFPLILMQQKAMEAFIAQKQMVQGVYYGIMLAMIIYNLFLYLSIRSRSYLYYVYYLTFVTIAISFYDGMAQLVIFDDNPVFAYRGINYFTALACLFGVVFGRRFLHSADNTPRLDKLLRIFIGVMGFYFVTEWIYSREISAHIITALSLVFLVLMVTLGVICVLRQIDIAKFFLAAWVLMLLGSASALVMLMGGTSYNVFAGHGVHLGTALEALVLSFALAYRINQLRSEKQKSALAAKRALEEKNRQLELTNTMKDQFFSVMSHELRTPINGIVGSLELLQIEGLSDEQTKHYQLAQESAKDMLHLVRNLLLYSELQFEHLKLRITKVDLAEFTQQVVFRYRGLATGRKISFEYRIDKSVPSECYFDSTYMRVLLEHLLDNAFKFSGQGVIQFTVKHNGDQLIFNVIDQGEGISPALKAKIFQPFSQNEQNYNRRFGGMGIGLALCNKLAQVMKGSLELLDVPGGGTNAQVTVHCASETTATQLPPVPEIIRRPIQTILLVDDNPTNLLLLKKIVDKLGFDSVTAENGQQVLDYLAEHSVDLIFMDCQMPVLDGYETTKAIRAMNNNKSRIPIIAVTANAMSKNKDLCEEAGMDGYISKPYTIKRIEECIQQWRLVEQEDLAEA